MANSIPAVSPHPSNTVSQLAHLINTALQERCEISTDSHSEEVESKIMTVAQQLREEGREEGIKLVKLEIAKQLLTEKSGLSDSELIPLVQRITDLSIKQIKELQADMTQQL